MSESTVNGNRAKTKSTSGWRAFDLKERRKYQGLQSEIDSEPYPLLSAAPIPQQILLTKNGALLEKKPFSSLLVPSNQVPVSDSSQKIDIVETYKKLNYLHPWADESLIQDVLAGVDNNIDDALSLLEAMLDSQNKDAKDKKLESNHVNDDTTSFNAHGVPIGDKKDMSFVTKNDYIDFLPEASSRLLLDASKSVPIEPEYEWEEDDVYLIHRKDAIRMIRSASRHSKAANDAYVRGDHLSAVHFSVKAQEEWTAAEKLNAEAAKTILTVRNSKNDQWTLDLHGLHAGEAVQALQERLQAVEKSRKHHPSSRQMPTSLQVITGNGNHSRGAAALPPAIRIFLSENGYHFDETRPGVIMIRLKFRHK